MTDETRKKMKEGAATIGSLVAVLIVATLGWFLLSVLAHHARLQDSAEIAKGLTPADYNQAKTWAADILGLAATLGGFLGIVAAAKSPTLDPLRVPTAEAGMIGILAGATLLGLGGWPVPVALVVLIAGPAVARAFK